jgi:hypothetical protein
MILCPAISQRYGLIRRLITLILFGFGFAAASVHAHEIRPAVVDIQLQADGSLEAEIRLNLEAVLAGIAGSHQDSDDSEGAPVYNRLRSLTPSEMQREFALFQSEFLQGIVLRADGIRLRLAVQGVSVPAIGDQQLARDSAITLSGALPAAARTLTWEWDRRFGASVVRIDAGDGRELYTAYLQPGAVSDDIDLGAVVAQSTGSIFGNYLVIGFEHIIPKGADHILFVVGLYLLSPGWRVLLWQVTAFTLAHTLTLALSKLGWVQMPATIVEPLIAASIVYVCIENLFHQRLTRWRTLVVFAFGLLHGLGFASVLTDVGLSPGHLATGLIAFNLGVELGQLAVLALCFLLVGLWFRNRSWYREVIAIPASLVIALVGSYWLVERTLLA